MTAMQPARVLGALSAVLLAAGLTVAGFGPAAHEAHQAHARHTSTVTLADSSTTVAVDLTDPTGTLVNGWW